MCGVELVPVERLKPADYNPRRADAERLALVRLSLSRLGFLLPIVATPDGEILSGHQRHAVAMSMGARQVPVMFVDIPQERRRGLNILFNRATNDIPMTADEVRLRAELQCANAHELAERLPDLDPNGPEFWPCLSLATRSVRELACRNVASFQPQSANVGRTLARLGVQLPIVLTEDDAVVNGIGRLEAAARKGRETIEAITVSPVKAELARAMRILSTGRSGCTFVVIPCSISVRGMATKRVCSVKRGSTLRRSSLTKTMGTNGFPLTVAGGQPRGSFTRYVPGNALPPSFCRPSLIQCPLFPTGNISFAFAPHCVMEIPHCTLRRVPPRGQTGSATLAALA
ncbi:ParB N-terminal domain-containing protein [Bilophila wadsworthia]|uniref:ParB N-terminal domain-containing protein n=1 Tax=Bilophila wadsworthia TaxID=35833 RepID=UPI0032C0872D